VAWTAFLVGVTEGLTAFHEVTRTSLVIVWSGASWFSRAAWWLTCEPVACTGLDRAPISVATGW